MIMMAIIVISRSDNLKEATICSIYYYYVCGLEPAMLLVM